jgi:hypothetical protein
MQAAKRPCLTKKSQGEFKPSRFQPTGNSPSAPYLAWRRKADEAANEPEWIIASEGLPKLRHSSTQLLVGASHLTYLAAVRDSAERGLGCVDNCHLNDFAESIFGNVGDSAQAAKASSPLMPGWRVGALIVV